MLRNNAADVQFLDGHVRHGFHVDTPTTSRVLMDAGLFRLSLHLPNPHCTACSHSFPLHLPFLPFVTTAYEHSRFTIMYSQLTHHGIVPSAHA